MNSNQHCVKNNFSQKSLMVFHGSDMPFSDAQQTALHAQILRVIVSAKLPFRRIEDPEMITILIILRGRICDVLPSHELVAGHLLDDAN